MFWGGCFGAALELLQNRFGAASDGGAEVL